MDIEELKRLASEATALNIDTAEKVIARKDYEYTECPTCDGEGSVPVGNDYCNFDDCAIGVQFYGIGDEHVKAEAYFRAANPQAILELIDQLATQSARIAELEKTVCRTVGWCVADACNAIDAGVDYRTKEIPEILHRALNELDLTDLAE